MDKIIGMGNALVDVLVRIDDDSLLGKLHLPKGSMQLIQEDTLSEIRKYTSGMKIHRSTGGSAGNTVCALAALGANPGFIGKVGQDETGAFFGDTLRQCGVNALLATCDLPSGIASTFISTDGERTFGTYLGAAATLRAEDLSRKMFAGYNYLYIEGYLLQDHDLMLRAVQLAKEEGLQVCLDMASYNVVEAERDFFDQLIVKYVDIVFANESEALAYTGKAPHEALEEIASKCSIAVVKLGARGSLVRKGSEVLKVDALPVRKVIDTTGAGDYFAAGFLYGLTCGYSLEKCGRIASLLSSKVIQVAGAELSPARWRTIRQNIENL